MAISVVYDYKDLQQNIEGVLLRRAVLTVTGLGRWRSEYDPARLEPSAIWPPELSGNERNVWL